MKARKGKARDYSFYLNCFIVATPFDGGQWVSNHLDGDVPLFTHSQALDLLLLIIFKPWSLCTKSMTIFMLIKALD